MMWYLKKFAFLVLSALIVMLVPATFLFLNLDRGMDSFMFVFDAASYVALRMAVPYLAIYFALVFLFEQRGVSGMRPYVIGGLVCGLLVFGGYCMTHPVKEDDYLPLGVALTIAGGATAWVYKKISKR